MHAFGASTPSPRARSVPSERLRVAVTFRGPHGEPGPTKFDPPLSMGAAQRFSPDPFQMDRAVYELARLGFTPTCRGRLTVSMQCTRQAYERAFGTGLKRVDLDSSTSWAFHSLYFPPDGAPWRPQGSIVELIDDAYIQWPHIYMAKPKAKTRTRKKAPKAHAAGGPSAKPPKVGYYHLEMPKDVPALLNVAKVHAAGTTGKGVRVVMVDSGFAHVGHPWFGAHGYHSTVDLAPGATNDATDPNGHGTGESANLFAVAPDATFIGVKVDNDANPQEGASLLEGFQTALQHRPDVISISLGYDLRAPGNRQLADLPNSLAALEAEVQAAVAQGIVVVFSAGNGHYSFPGMMPDVVSAGGVYVDEHGGRRAADYASAFDSAIYPGRHVPDFSGLVGMLPTAAYIMLPIPESSETDRNLAPADGTTRTDAWGVFSGTSAAAPQIAGVCALLKQKDPHLTPGDVKAILRRSAVSVTVGHANPASSAGGGGMPASTGDTGAAGAGLVDAYAAWRQL